LPAPLFTTDSFADEPQVCFEKDSMKSSIAITLCLVLLCRMRSNSGKGKSGYQAVFLTCLIHDQIVGYSDSEDLFSEQVNYV
jgi:hypothetical protein